MDKLLILPATINDINEIWEIEKLSFSVPWTREALGMEIVKNKCAKYYAAKNYEGKLIGYGGFWVIVDQAHITNVAVHPQYRRHGVGEAVMRHMLKQAYKLGLKDMTLEVRESNAPAIKLYKKLGFIECGVRKKYYSDNNENAIIMWKFNIGKGDF